MPPSICPKCRLPTMSNNVATIHYDALCQAVAKVFPVDDFDFDFEFESKSLSKEFTFSEQGKRSREGDNDIEEDEETKRKRQRKRNVDLEGSDNSTLDCTQQNFW